MHHKPKHPKSDITIAGRHDAGTKAQRWLLPVLLVAQLMVILDITAVNIALPHIATDLHLSGSNISWTITSYSLSFGSLLLFGGRAADLLGRRRRGRRPPRPRRRPHPTPRAPSPAASPGRRR